MWTIEIVFDAAKFEFDARAFARETPNIVDGLRRSWMVAASLGAVACGGSIVEAASEDVASSDGTDVGAPPEVTSDGEVTGSGPHGSGDGASSSSSDAPTLDGSTGAAPGLGPPYPIVLAHGFFGFEDFAGAGFADYFWGIKDDLELRGEVNVFTPAVDPFNDSEVRGLALLEQVEAIVAATGYAKVNLVGHSQGGLDARVVAHLRPDLVASVTTIAAPHGGSIVADIALGLVPSPQAQALTDALVQLIGAPLWSEIGTDTSLAASLGQFSTPGIAAFNDAYPDAPGLPYYAVAGRSSLHLGGSLCSVEDAPAFIQEFADERDPIDAGFSVPAAILSGSVVDPSPNDGLVLVESAIWGRFLGCVPADHTDEIGHLFGDGAGLGNGWDFVEFYAELVAFLRTEEL